MPIQHIAEPNATLLCAIPLLALMCLKLSICLNALPEEVFGAPLALYVFALNSV